MWTSSPPCWKFQPAPPVGAETPSVKPAVTEPDNFNPLRPWGRRRLALGRLRRRLDFNPLRPWGRRPTMTTGTLPPSLEFQPAPPVGAET